MALAPARVAKEQPDLWRAFQTLGEATGNAGPLSERELQWLNDYHAEVLARIGPRLAGEDRAWLATACAPI